MRIFLLSYILLGIFFKVYGQLDTFQTDTTRQVYGNLKIIKWPDVEKCRPCIIIKYDSNKKLIEKSIRYTDCPVGYFIRYFPNGKVRAIEHYKENLSKDWNNIYDRGYCRKDGACTYFDEQGNKLYSEYWKNGEFIKQVPEQIKAEIWAYDLVIKGIKTYQETFTFEEIKDLKIVPKFKNKTTLGTNISIFIDLSAIGHRSFEKEFTLDNFHDLDIAKFIDESGFKSTESVFCTIKTYDNNINIFNEFIKVEK